PDLNFHINIVSYMGDRAAISGETSDEIRLPRLAYDTQHTLRAQNDARLLASIDKALSRLDHGTYGFCECCGAEISVQRLMANPLTSICDDCEN
ncbi:MAG: TraR/DksA family transcriptional regulator, partial [Pseudomonadota bacterium]